MHLLTYSAYAFVLLTVTWLAGRAFLPFRNAENPDSLNSVVLSLTVGLSLGVTIATWWAYTDRSNAFGVYLFFGVSLVGLYKVTVAFNGGISLRGLAETKFLAAGALACSAVYWPVFKNSALPNGLTAFTNANNDLSVYSHYADNIANSGFKEFGRVSSRAAGAMAINDHTGDSAFFGLSGRLLRVEVWSVGIPVIIFVSAITVITLASLLRKVAGTGTVVSIVIALWACTGPITGTVQANYFLGQAFCRAVLFGLVATLFAFESATTRLWLQSFVIALGISACLLMYPSGALVNAVLLASLSCLVVGLKSLHKHSKSEFLAMTRHYVLPVVIGLVSSIVLIAPRFDRTLDSIRFYLKAGITGWPLPTWKPEILSNLGFTDLASLSRYWKIYLLVFVCLIVLAAFRSVHLSVDWAVVVTLFVIPVISYAYFAVTQGSTTYQTWKILGIVQPLAVGVLLGLGIKALSSFKLNASASTQKFLTSFGLTVALAFTFLGIDMNQAHFRSVTQIIPESLSVLRDKVEVPEGQVLGIRLNPYFETMIAPMVLNLHQVVWSSDTYAGPGAQADIYLERLSNQPSEKIVMNYGEYVLVRP
jgi:hypothetical protein